jgi:hypothetical protein
VWPWPWKLIGFQNLLRTKYVPSLVKIHWKMLILECSQGWYRVKIRPCDLDLWPWKSIGFQTLLRTKYSAPSVYHPRFIANLAYCQNSRLSRFPPLKIPRYTAKLSYRHPPQVFRYKSRKTNLNSPVSSAHNYHLTAVYWSVIMECQNWSSDTVINLIVEGRNRWSVVLIRIIICIYFSSDYICTFNTE